MSAAIPTVAEYMAHGMDEKSAVAMVKAEQAFDGARDYAKARGWLVRQSVGAGGPKTESRLYSQGWRPILLNEDGTIRFSILGVWVKPAHLTDMPAR